MNKMIAILVMVMVTGCLGESPSEITIDYPLDSMVGGTVINSQLRFGEDPVVIGPMPGERVTRLALTFSGAFRDVVVTAQVGLSSRTLRGRVAGQTVKFDVSFTRFPVALSVGAARDTVLASAELTVTPDE